MVAGLVVLFAGGCSQPSSSLPASQAASGGAVTILSYHLDGYGLGDRDADGEPDDPKPPEECEAVAQVIAAASADIVALQGLGTASDFEQLATSVERLGAAYPYREVLHLSASPASLGVLSRLPIASRQSKEVVPYRIGEHELSLSHGILDLTFVTDPASLLRLVVVEFKDKTFHPAGQTEMRRNEARLLANHLRLALAQSPDCRILVAGALQDEPESAPVNELTAAADAPVTDLRPADDREARWTARQPGRDAYLRTDYLLASPGLIADIHHARTQVLDVPAVRVASTHRPLITSIRSTPGESQDPLAP